MIKDLKYISPFSKKEGSIYICSCIIAMEHGFGYFGRFLARCFLPKSYEVFSFFGGKIGFNFIFKLLWEPCLYFCSVQYIIDFVHFSVFILVLCLVYYWRRIIMKCSLESRLTYDITVILLFIFLILHKCLCKL